MCRLYLLQAPYVGPIIAIIAMWLCVGCQPTSGVHDNKEDVVSVVGGQYLRVQDVDMDHLLPQDLDSAHYLKQYVHNWVLEELMFRHAEQAVTLDMDAIATRVRNYHKTLVLHALEKRYIEHTLNPVVSAEEISRYYTENINHFVLNEDIVKLLYVKVPRISPLFPILRRTLQRTPLGKVSPQLSTYCLKSPYQCMLNDTSWVTVDKLLERWPVKYRRRVVRRLGKRGYIDVQYLDNMYLLRILDHRKAGSIPPIGYLRKEIVYSILNKRKKELIKALRAKVWNKAKRNNAFEIYL